MNTNVKLNMYMLAELECVYLDIKSFYLKIACGVLFMYLLFHHNVLWELNSK